ncbi:N-acetyltransferase [Cohnella lubricantis]|uniref:GNAT family N-acetyltransferase n=1 Tax=Cohnella lubricantis TaxID=2163172 RepID=A0A841THA2_9BACL|nr:N-acetyltransferase [Cohnella lubricantis]MBB6677831.1 GNAT family N-acetyltransferase [Cohnella lubricantis]MBP2120493.1 ribosomal protein S18 acetylase RimI-like enzyme [Cohnella lubricantis]
MHIRILQESDAQTFQQLRLAALQNNPEAFGSTYDREAQFSLDTVKDRLRPTSDKFVLGAFVDKELAGIVSFVREGSVKTAHKANIYGMYVAPERRGSGIGRALLLELIEISKTCGGLEQLNLTVVSDNEAAKGLYHSLGFESYGVESNALKFNGCYYDEDLMALRLSISGGA